MGQHFTRGVAMLRVIARTSHVLKKKKRTLGKALVPHKNNKKTLRKTIKLLKNATRRMRSRLSWVKVLCFTRARCVEE